MTKFVWLEIVKVGSNSTIFRSVGMFRPQGRVLDVLLVGITPKSGQLHRSIRGDGEYLNTEVDALRSAMRSANF